MGFLVGFKRKYLLFVLAVSKPSIFLLSVTYQQGAERVLTETDHGPSPG